MATIWDACQIDAFGGYIRQVGQMGVGDSIHLLAGNRQSQELSHKVTVVRQIYHYDVFTRCEDIMR